MNIVIKSFFTYILIMSFALAGTGCDTKDPAPDAGTTTPETDAYISSQLKADASLSVLQSLASSQQYALFRNDAKYGVSTYKMVYYTTYKGEQIKASGLICIPHMDAPAPIISMQHATIFSNEEAPSNYSGISEQELLTSAGYVTLVPDYIGYGESASVLHPYYDQLHSALAVVDMIKAAKTFCQEKDVALNDKLFLIGYSEGGYVTLAAQEEIETNPAHDLEVTAVAAGAGGYDVASLLGLVTSGEPYYFPASFAFLLQAYNNTNDWDRPLTDFFQEPYASKIPTLFNGINNGNTINEQLPIDPKKLFNPTFYEGLKDESKELQLKDALQANSFTDWAPQSPTRLYHGTADIIIPYQNSKKTYERFLAEGAKQTKLIPIENGTHEDAYGPMLESALPWLKTF
ncbi:alpha/beta fold hydrolase [Pontibacter sp. 172403-2]|uniref:alpha/beta fold hydrolase n=1 Tax=Pontibacter rufus TaxID=2791028 RepID=UPI0018AFABAF|nr:alpha/beta fold hydrolase [Pontibacter sp. 172403-2]MBF9251813.1 alpha/beta fold hydrolase [Pontibacter sp. 172403-2]